MPSNAIAFCVVDTPYVVWGADVVAEHRQFLDRLDSQFHLNAVYLVLQTQQGYELTLPESTRKQVAPLARLLWHHGVEALITLIGAYMQAPYASHGYFLKCSNPDLTKIGYALLNKVPLKYNHLQGGSFSIDSLISGIFRCSGWEDNIQLIQHFSRFLESILADFVSAAHRREYNSLKHGMRVSYGPYSAVEQLQNIMGHSSDNMEVELSDISRDSSQFVVTREFHGASKSLSKINFLTETVTVTWSLEKVVFELQLISMLSNNIVSAWKISNGVSPEKASFMRPSRDRDWWSPFFSVEQEPWNVTRTGPQLQANDVHLASEKDVFDTYKSTKSVF